MLPENHQSNTVFKETLSQTYRLKKLCLVEEQGIYLKSGIFYKHVNSS